MSEREKSVNDIVKSAVTALGYELWGLETSGGKNVKYTVYIDSPNGVNVDDCAEVSRQISALFAVEAPGLQEAHLEVSSPGVERPLFTLDQCRRYIGETVRVKLKFPVDERKRFKGQLMSVEDGEVVLEVDESEWRFAFSDIDRATLSPEL